MISTILFFGTIVLYRFITTEVLDEPIEEWEENIVERNDDVGEPLP